MSQKSERTKELEPYIIYIRDYDKLINLEEEEYQKEFADVVKEAVDHVASKKTKLQSKIVAPTKENPIVTLDFLKTRPLSYSSLKNFRISPKHYIQYLTEVKVDKEAYLLGNVFECCLDDQLFNKKDFDLKYCVYRPATGTGSMAINKAEKEHAKEKGITLVTPEMMDTVDAMLESLMSTDYVRPYINGIEKSQITLHWTDRKTKLPFIGKVDYESEVHDTKWAIDLKTAASGDPFKFQRDAYNFDYNTQWSTYSEGYHKSKLEYPSFIYLVVEKTEPYNVSLFFIENKTLTEDKIEWRNSVNAFKFCMDNQLFHQGYEFLIQAMDYFALRRPGYYRPRF